MIWAAILGGSLGCYLVKLAGLSVPERVLRDERVRRAAALLPVALLAALASIHTFGSEGEVAFDVRGLAVGAALVAILARAPFAVVVLVAALVAAGTRLALA
ncbi:MAG TPA: AzlD domain-containing protein [Pseudonocardia sp.]|nr:AzlD domain-containing protein [Pseudonocardia sp.]